MKKLLLSSLAIGVGLFMLPTISSAATVQTFTGNAAVYMDYKTGKDELIVNNYQDDSNLDFDIYSSATPKAAGSWTLNRSYTLADFPDENPDLYYSQLTQPAVRFNGVWYFSIDVQSMGEFTSIPESIQIWRITGRGAKPERVLNVADSSLVYFMHQPVVVLNGVLVYISASGSVYQSTNGTDWTNTNSLSLVVDIGNANDLVSTGSKLYLAVAGLIYSSTDAATWSSVGNVCATETDTCSVDQITLHPGKGLFAVTKVSTDTATTYHLWMYKNSTWTETASFNNTVRTLNTFGKHVYADRYGSAAGYKYIISEIASDGSVANLTSRRAGTLLGFATGHLAIVNPKYSSSTKLISY